MIKKKKEIMQHTHSSSSPVRSDSTPPSQRGRFRLRDVPDEESMLDAGESARQPTQAPQRHPQYGVSPSSHESDDLHAEEDVATRRSRVLLRRRTAPYSAHVPDAASNLDRTAANARAVILPEEPCDQRCCGWVGSAGAHLTPRAARAASPDTQPLHSSDGSGGLDGVLESLTRLLRAYLPPPSTEGEGGEASGVNATTMYDKARQWCCFLPNCIDVSRNTPPSPFAMTRAAAQPEHVPSSPRLSPPQLQRCARRHQLPDDRHHRAAHADFTQHVEMHQRLWFLLTQYPQDASCCLSLCFSLNHVLELMRQTPPPTLPLLPSPDSTDTCPCGCLIDGCFADTMLHGFHRYYYRLHQPRGEVHAKSRPQPRRDVDDEQEVPQHAAAATVPSLSSLQAALNSEVMPLLAIQILAEFVWQCSEKYVSEQQSRASKRASLQSRVHADVMKIIALSGKTEQTRRDRSSQLGGARTEHSVATQQQRCSSADVRVSIDTSSAAFAAAYKSFCPAPRNVWAVIACVDLAWCQLEEHHALFFFLPQLTVLGGFQKSRADGQPHQGNVSALQEVAAEVNLAPDVLDEILHRRCAHLSDNSAVPKLHADALHHLRMRLLTQVHQPRRTRGKERGGERDSSDDTAQAPLQTALAEEELHRMEAFVCPLVGGRTARMPPWCAVALEVQQLYSESRHRGRRVRQRVHGHLSADAVESDTAEERMYCLQVRLLVRWLVRLLLLPTLRPKRAPSSCFTSAERSNRETSAAAEAGTAGGDDTAWQENMSALSDWMMLHPLFGVAVAVACDVVPLYWAASCVIGTTFTTAAEERASGPGSSSGGSSDTVVAELERIGQRIRMWLRQGGERSREE